MDIDYAIRKDEPIVTEASSQVEIALYELWKRSNHLSMIFIKTKISTGIQGSVNLHDNVKALLKVSDKAFISTLIMKFSSMRLTTIRGVREHIMQMRDIVAQLKTLEVEMSESFLVDYVLNTLP
ncbi:hypothetical protein OWV82_012034 [Melia azedarach]|uniref:Uncharacterized protein n=1 Tax=Melia azedarach TaxID=155640 RepID=A0ACC1Y276_MELAZ|nr:hypothetical protein OWV82_012034 [Melia azedarach]